MRCMREFVADPPLDPIAERTCILGHSIYTWRIVWRIEAATRNRHKLNCAFGCSCILSCREIIKSESQVFRNVVNVCWSPSPLSQIHTPLRRIYVGKKMNLLILALVLFHLLVVGNRTSDFFSQFCKFCIFPSDRPIETVCIRFLNPFPAKIRQESRSVTYCMDNLLVR